VEKLALNRMEAGALGGLVSLGLVRIAGFTPSDAAHVLDLHDAWHGPTAHAAAALVARRKDRKGNPLAPDGEALARMVIDTLTRRSAQVLLDTTLAHDGLAPLPPALLDATLDRRDGASRVDIGLALPLIGLGASAPTYYPRIGAMLGTPCIVPEHADVANAVGAVAGRVTLDRSVRITSPVDGLYRLHLTPEAQDFADLDAAKAAARTAIETALTEDAARAGANDVEIVYDCTESAPMVEGRPMFIEAFLAGRASGRPSLRRPD